MTINDTLDLIDFYIECKFLSDSTKQSIILKLLTV